MKHQIKLVVRPPSKTTTSVGRFWKIGLIPFFSVIAEMGFPNANPKEKQELNIPEMVATNMPLRKLNSAIVPLSFDSPKSFSFITPAFPQIPMPVRQSRTPARIIFPEPECQSEEMVVCPLGFAIRS